MSFLFLHLSILILIMSSSQFFSTMEEYEELICLVRNLKLEVIEYSKQINGPRGFAHSSDDEDDDDDGGDPKTTPSYQPSKRCNR